MNALKPILLVDDNPHDVALTLAAFERSKLANEIVTARDGVEALDYLQGKGRYAGRNGQGPLFVLLDNKMPRLTGIEVLRKLKADPALRTIPVVMLTSSREDPDLREAYSLGVNAYVVKPVDFQQFMDAVQQIGAFWALINQGPPE